MNLTNHRRVEQNDNESRMQAVHDGYEFIGTLHTYSLQLSDYTPEIDIVSGTKFKKAIPACIDIAHAAFSHSRLFVDIRIPVKDAKAVYAKRVREAFYNSEVYLAVHRDDWIIGFCVLNDNEIELIAVDPKHQKRGVGKRFISRCIETCRDMGLDDLIMKTQGSNRIARNFLETQEFNRIKIEEDFHKKKGI